MVENVERSPGTGDRRTVEPETAPRASRVYLVVAALSAVLVLIRSIYLGYDTNFDLLYYHLYKSHAIIDGSLWDDVAVTGLGTFLNPVIELPTVVGVALFGDRWGLILSAAVVQFACYLAVWRLADQLGRARGLGERSPFAAAVFAICVTGSIAVSISFTTFGDWIAAAILCEAMRALLSPAEDGHVPRIGGATVAGLWAGLALGLKLTVAPFVLGIVVGVWATKGFRTALRASIGVMPAFAAVAGPWMMYLQLRYSSPVFPFYNGLFRASSAPDADFDDNRFGATGLRSFVEFPAELMRGTGKYSEFVMQDWRFAVLATLLAVAVVLDAEGVWRDEILRLFGVVLAVGFVVWLTMFGIYRYFVFGELLASALVGLLVLRLLGDQRRTVVACVGGLVLGASFQISPDWGRDAELTSESLREALSDLPTSPSVLLVDATPPNAYFLHLLPDETSMVGLWSLRTGSLLYEGEMKDEVDSAVRRGIEDGALYALVDPADQRTTLLDGRLSLESCWPFTLTGRELAFCRVGESE